jgi:nucleoside 2-deoxyribosyltransferase
VVERIKRLIKESSAVIADLSEAKSNVLYEVGYAHALKRPTIHICSTPLEQLPFDVRNWNTITYVKGQTHKLKTDLARRLKAIL